MSLLDTILSLRRPRIWERFRDLRKRAVPEGTDPQEAFHLGLQAGYGEGLVDGVDLGIDASKATVTTYDSPDGFDYIQH